jgi:hypothetical protein
MDVLKLATELVVARDQIEVTVQAEHLERSSQGGEAGRRVPLLQLPDGRQGDIGAGSQDGLGHPAAEPGSTKPRAQLVELALCAREHGR